MFAVALVVLYYVLRNFRFSDILVHLSELSWYAFAQAVALTAAGYFVLTFYDVLALRHVRRRVPYRKSAVASFIGFAFAHNMGMAPLTGGTIRLRIYSEEGLNASEIATIIMFCTLTFSLGIMVVGSASLLFLPEELLAGVRLSELVAHPLAILTLVVLAAYVVLTWRWRAPIRILGFVFELPTLASTCYQIALATIDLLLAGLVLYVLLPGSAELSFWVFMAIYMVAVFAGMMSHVPGGLGVFEVIVVLMMPDAPPDVVFAALLAYRGTYFLLPFAAAAATLGIREAIISRHLFDRWRKPKA